jgi:two-component system phosphate regulon sensor histidine kinase PhoR
MSRRLFAALALVQVVVLGGLALAIRWRIAESDLRDELTLSAGLAFLAGLGLSAILSVALARRITRPLRELIAAFEKVGQGRAAARVYPATSDEVSLLGRSFNRMSEKLAARIGALEEDRQQLRTILGGMVEGVVALDPDQRVLFVNDRAGELLDLSRVPAVGRALWEVVRHRPLLDAVKRALESREPHREEFSWTGSTPRTLTVHAARLPGESPRGAVLVLHDTTELRRLETLRQDFVANVSHELKTPLSVIKVCVETLLDGAVEDPLHRGRFLEQIARQADRLHALILDLLSLARIESGAELFHFTSVPLQTLAEACIERHRPRAEARNQRLDIEVVRPGLQVWADEEAVDQILENLLDNALKYTGEGGSIRIRLGDDSEQGTVEVVDSGIGIPAADLPRIFERFYRVDKARSREMGGTGLGLAIVKHLVQAMHGNVRASSEPRVGTTFRVQLPLARD